MGNRSRAEATPPGFFLPKSGGEPGLSEIPCVRVWMGLGELGGLIPNSHDPTVQLKHGDGGGLLANSQKDENRFGLYAAVVLNTVVLYCLVTSNRVEPERWIDALANWQLAIPAAAGLAFITILNSQISTRQKEWIVFWQWDNPLPGSRAFTHFLQSDSRIDAAQLQSRFGPFPTEPFAQNQLWYRIYSTVRDEPAIATQRRSYLFARDYAVLVVLMLVVLGCIALVQLRSPLLFIIYTGALALQYILAANAARKTAERWVTTAMAMASVK